MLRVFTKNLKLVFSYFRELGHLSVIYVDDSKMQGQTQAKCLQNIKEIVKAPQCTGYHYCTTLFNAKLLHHLTRAELRSWAGSNPAGCVSEVCDGEKLRQ